MGILGTIIGFYYGSSNGAGAAAPEPQEPPEAPAEAAAEPAAPQKADPTCVGPLAKGKPEALRIGEVDWELSGSTLTKKTPGDSLVIGAVTDVKEDTEENLGNLKQLLAWFEQKKVDLIVLAGALWSIRRLIQRVSFVPKRGVHGDFHVQTPRFVDTSHMAPEGLRHSGLFL